MACIRTAFVAVCLAGSAQAVAQHHPQTVSPGSAPPPSGQEMPLWRTTLATKFEPLTLEQALAKAKAEHKLVVVFRHPGPDPWACATSDAFRNPTLASYLAWRCVTIHIGTPTPAPSALPAADTQRVDVLLPVGSGFQVLDSIRPPRSNMPDAPALGGIPNSTFGGLLEIVPTAVNVLFRVDFARERLCARDPAWGMESDRLNPMPEAPPPEDPLHQVEDDAAVAIADPAPDDPGWRRAPAAGNAPADPSIGAVSAAPYDVLARLDEARAAVRDNDLRRAAGLYTWLWERSEALDPAARSFRRTILPLEMQRLAEKNGAVRKRFGAVRDQLSHRLPFIDFGELMVWFTLNEVCGDFTENVLYLDLYSNDRDEATMMPRAHFAAYRLIGAREKFIDPWRVDQPGRPGTRSSMPGDPDEAALAHVQAVARRLSDPRKANTPPKDFEELQAFRRDYLVDEAARLHVALLRAGREHTAARAIDVAGGALETDAQRGQLYTAAVFCALGSGYAHPMHTDLLTRAARAGRPNLTLELRLAEALASTPSRPRP